MTNSTQETFWILRAQVGDREAMDQLFRQVQGPLFSYLSSILLNSTLAEDTLQDVFLTICRKLKSLRDPELFRPWAFRIASRRAFRVLKKEKRWRDEVRDHELLNQQPDDQLTPTADSIDIESIRNLMDRLSPPVRAVLALHYFESMTIAEVATVLSIPVGTAKSRLAYGLQELRSALIDTTP